MRKVGSQFLYRVRSVFTAPVFEGDTEKTNIGKHIHVITWFASSLAILYAIILLFIAPQFRNRLFLIPLAIACQVPVLRWARQGRVRLAAFVSMTTIWLAFGYSSAINGGVRSAVFSGNIVLLLTAAILLGRRTAFGFALLSFLQGLILVWAEYRGLLPPVSTTPVSGLLIQSMFFLAGAGSLYFANYSIKESLDKARHELQERQKFEAALRESEQRYRLISTVASDYMFSTQLDENGELNLNWVAGAFEAITGYTYEEYVSLGGWRAMLHPDDFAQDESDMNTLRMNKPIITEVRSIHKNGSVRWVRVYAHPVWDENSHKLAGIFGAVQDITARKAVEAEREALISKLEAQNAELERFTYTVSHDLKSPLVTMRGFLGYIEKDVLTGDIDRFKKDLSRITEAAIRMQRLLTELLELSRIGRIMNPSVAVPFETIVQEAIDQISGRLQERPVQIEVMPDLPVLMGDRNRLVEVVQNLLDNACKFIGDQPHPKIQIGVQGFDNLGNPILYIQDNGIGIDPQYHEKVFGLFNKLNPDTEGTGIGLALVKRIVEVHQGKIWIESPEAGNGTRFCFTLPAAA